MRALVFHGPDRMSWDEVPDPVLVDDTDALVRVTATTLCGTDLHLLAGDPPGVTAGRVLGHEAVGVVTAVGSAVTARQVGDRVLVSCISACGRCRSCRERQYSQCLDGGGWVLGNTVDGTQAELVRVPFADTSTYQLPEGLEDEAALMLSDILPTAYEVGVVNGGVAPGDTVVIVGAGPVGLATILAARLFSPAHVVAVDVVASRLEVAKEFGADVTVDSTREDPVAVLLALTGGRGADVAVEAVGLPGTFETCTRLVRAGGRVANVGVHSAPVTLHLEELWSRNITLTTGLVNTWSTPTLLTLVASGQLDVARFVTHRYALEDIVEAYDTFGRAADTAALKVVLTTAPVQGTRPT